MKSTEELGGLDIIQEWLELGLCDHGLTARSFRSAVHRTSGALAELLANRQSIWAALRFLYGPNCGKASSRLNRRAAAKTTLIGTAGVSMISIMIRFTCLYCTVTSCPHSGQTF
jgi:hypothetical protein